MATGGQEQSDSVETSQPTATSKPERMFSKSEVNELMKKRVGRSHSAFFNRYGVKDLDELDALFGQASGYGPLKEKYDGLDKNYNELSNSHKDLVKRYAYKMNNVNPEKVSDIETYFKGKNLEIDEATLAKELKTHPEWVGKASVIRSIGAEASPQPDVDERAMAERYFNVRLKK